MKVAVYSDLHNEFDEFIPPRLDADLVILAGDIHVKSNGVAWAAKHFPDMPVLYVPGNHEFYKTAYPRNTEKMKARAALFSNIHILDRDHVEIEGIHFLGTTLWTDFSLFGDPRIAGHHAQLIMSDYKLIRRSPGYSRLRSMDVYEIHRKQRDWLEAELKRLKGERVVVITHHAPSRKSLAQPDTVDLIMAADASDLDGLIEKYQPQYWLHGHVHVSSRYQINATTVICNPRGYIPDSPNLDFNENLILEL